MQEPLETPRVLRWSSNRVLGSSEQAHYEWRANPVPVRDWDQAHLINAALDAHDEDPAFGYRFLADELREPLAAAGITAGENRVARLCSQQRIWSVFAEKRGLNRKAGPRSTTTSWTACSPPSVLTGSG